MTGSALSSYLFTNKVAVKTGVKVSISVWGALIIGLLMNFEHPVWCMITGMISFFAPDHAQVVKKCLFQCISTVLGGLLGLALMACTSQSPLMIGLGVAAILFVGASLSYHTRDANFTFCCAIFSVTVVIIVMIPGYVGPTSEEFIAIFIDRVGAIIAGISWAALVSAALWPKYSTEALRGACQKLLTTTLALNTFDTSPSDLRARMAKIYATIIECHDLADHCQVEGHWGTRGARIARELNRLSIEIVSESYALHQLTEDEQQAVATELGWLERVASVVSHADWAHGKSNQSLLDDALERITDVMTKESASTDVTGRALLLAKIHALLEHLKSFVTLYLSLMSSARIHLDGIKIKRHLQWGNSLITGLRSSLLFLIVYGLWYATGWTQGFLITIVPVVFSIMLGKLPHPEMILKNILIGIAVAIPIGIAVYVLTAEAPSAVEILILVAGSVLFIALMGLSSLTSFAYSLGFCLSYMVLVLPLNSQAIALDIPFAIDRSMSIGIGAAILALLYILLPRRPLLKKGTLPGTLFEDDLRDVLLKFRHGRSAAETLAQRVGLIIDKLVTASVEVDAATKSTLIDKAGQSIFLLTQVRKVETYLERIGMSQQMAKQLIPWKSELFENYLSAAHTREHSLTSSVSAMQLPPELARAESASSRAFYLGEFDALIRRALEQSVLQEKM